MLRRDAQDNRIHLLILGLPRSGTSILSSLIGAHSKVAMLNEDFGKAWLNAIGKPVAGNKLCVPRQIGHIRKRNMVIKVMNRFGMFKFWPKSYYSVNDYLTIPNLKIIIIKRNQEKVVNSLKNRGNLTWYFVGKVRKRKLKPKEIDYTVREGSRILDYISEKYHPLEINFQDIINSSEESLKEICYYLGLEYESEMLNQGPQNNWMYPKESEKGLNVDK